jgi:ABC-type nitrate/sulfonate/bicarbonate transport system substrate-binding protein
MKINICGVPEHFNLPWKIGLENDVFEQENIQIIWKNVPEGTGKMCEMLRNQDTDMAIILTEGIIKDIALGNPSVIIQKYIETPLIWGVHIPYQFDYQNINDLKHQKIAISRLGSGSHLMSMLWAKKNNWDFTQNQYQIVNTIDGAVKSLSQNVSTVFMWEKFMTKPLVDNHTFQRIEDFPTPWPCFVIAVRQEFLENNLNIVQQILKTINKITENFKQTQDLIEKIAFEYHLQPSDVQEWLQVTEWSQKNFSESEFDVIQNQLLEVQIIPQKLNFNQVIKNIFS